ncbi:MAG: OB-fold nucleic acid binding domain-containing protein [Thermaurantiacus sp.]
MKPLLALAAAAAAVVAMPASSSTPIGSLDGGDAFTISGRVTSSFGNRFVLRDRSGEVLVDAGPTSRQEIALRRGERLTVVGRPHGGDFRAQRIERRDGTVIHLQHNEVRRDAREKGSRDRSRGKGRDKG